MQSYPAKNVRRIRLTIFALVGSGILISGPIGPTPAQQDFCTQRSVFVGVESEKGEPVSGLTPKNFHATLEKIELLVTGAEPAPLRRIVILLDQSGSMRDPFLYRTSSITLANIVRQSAPDTEFAFATYDGFSEVKSSLTPNHEGLIETVRQALAAKPPFGPSAMLDAIVSSLEVLTPSRPTDAVLVLTDGGENSSKISWADVERRFAGSGVRLFAIVFINGNDRYGSTGSRKTEQQRLDDLVRVTGGNIFWLDTREPSRSARGKLKFRVEKDSRNLSDIADSIIRTLTTDYLLQISVPATFVKPKDWKVELVGNPSGNGHQFFVRYTPKLYPCSLTATPK